MSRYTSGWVKLHRKILGSWIGRDGFALAIMDLLMLWANPEDGREPVRGDGFVLLKRGQLVTSADKIAAQLGFDKKTVQRRLQHMEEDGTIAQQVSHHGRIITLCNFEKYQGSEVDDVPLSVPPGPPPDGPPGPPPGPHIVKKERKREREKEEVNPQLAPKGSGGTPLPGDYALGDSWWDFAYSVVPTLKPNREAWANAIRLMREVDGLTEGQIRETLDFVRGDNFWRQQALSPVALRGRSKNGLKKLENVRLAMARDGGADHMAAFMAALPAEGA